jgi:uncharacterized membrane protein YeaQ/YmgE (transglycosylase-associated protein family)
LIVGVHQHSASPAGYAHPPKKEGEDMAVIWFLIVGLVAGLIARALVPGRDAMGFLATIVLGIVGSFVGGLLLVLFTGRTFTEFSTTGLIGSILGAIVALLIYRQMKARA